MKVAMIYDNRGRRGDKTICAFLCAKCGLPIWNLEEANFAPRDADDSDFPRKRIGVGLEVVEDRLEIWHWDCDEDHGVPWVNAAYSLAHYRGPTKRVKTLAGR